MADKEKQQAQREGGPQGGAHIIDVRLKDLEQEQAEQRKRSKETEQRDTAYKEAQVEIATEQTRIFAKQVDLERKQTSLTGALVLIGFLAIAVAGWQTYETRRSADAAIIAADAAKLAAQEARASREQAAKDADRIIAQNRRDSDANLSQSAAALNANIAQFRQEQRAWVGIENVPGSLEPEKPLGVVIFIKNSGRTPALDVRTQSKFQTLKDGMFPDFSYPTVDFQSSIIIQPNAAIKILLTGSQTLNEGQYDSLLTGTQHAWVYGRINYNDVFGECHWTTFCYYWERSPGRRAWHACDTYNEVDRDGKCESP